MWGSSPGDALAVEGHDRYTPATYKLGRYCEVGAQPASSCDVTSTKWTHEINLRNDKINALRPRDTGHLADRGAVARR